MSQNPFKAINLDKFKQNEEALAEPQSLSVALQKAQLPLIGGFEGGIIPTPDQFYSPFYIGLELECIGRSSDHLARLLKKRTKIPIKWNATPSIGDSFWGFTDDGSLGVAGTEIKTPINPPLQELKEMLNLLKEENMYINPNCGGHIHISHPNKNVGINLKKQVNYWWPREFYAFYSRANRTCRHVKYEPVRRVDERHLEVRIFNGSLAFRTLISRILLVKNSMLLDESKIQFADPKRIKIPRLIQLPPGQPEDYRRCRAYCER